MSAASPTAETPPTAPRIASGVCRVQLAFDVGYAIDLPEAERLIRRAAARRRFVSRRGRIPPYFEYDPLPLELGYEAPRVELAGFETSPAVEVLVFAFGAISVSFAIPIEQCPIDRLLALSDAIYDNPELYATARGVIDDLVRASGAAIDEPLVADSVEDYVTFHFARLSGDPPIAAFIAAQRQLLAQILRAETGPLSEQEVTDALACQVSYRPDDCTMIDWNAAILFGGEEVNDARAVLDFVNVELLEMRHLDARLDRTLHAAYAIMTRPPARRWLVRGVGSRDVSEWQVDSALLFEGVNNALKLVGDQHLARVYRLASERLHVPAWDASILRKLHVLETIYDRLSDQRANRRLELLEWIIILLIALSIVLPLLGFAAH